MSHVLLHAWEKTLSRCGDQRAIVQAADGRSVTFRELDACGSAWLGRHVPDTARLKGRSVVFAAPNGINWFELLLGLLKAGAVVVPLDAAEPQAAQRRLAESLRAGFWWDGMKLIPLAGAKRYREPELCLIKLTSGSTGVARPLVFTAGQLLADGRQVTATMGIKSRDLNYALIPLGHSYGLGNLTIPLLAHGVPLVCGSASLPHAIATDFARWRPTVFPGVPVLWRALAASDVRLDSLRLGISAGATLPLEVARNFATRFGRRLHNFYGSSETGGIGYDRTGTATLAGQVGQAMRGVTLKALSRERLQVVSAAVLTQGNQRKVGRLGAWIMSDHVVLDGRGRVTLLGRRGRTVKMAGRRVHLGEVTLRIRSVSGVRDVWVGTSTGPDPVLGAVVASGRTGAEIRTELQANVAAWMIPKKIVLVADLPLTARGKTDTRALQALLS